MGWLGTTIYSPIVKEMKSWTATTRRCMNYRIMANLLGQSAYLCAASSGVIILRSCLVRVVLPWSCDQRVVQRGKLQNAECILCGDCVDHCPAGAVRYAFGVPNRTPLLARCRPDHCEMD